MQFLYDEELDTWLYGTSFRGIGVFFQDYGWYSNVVYDGFIRHLGPYSTMDEAQQAGIYEFNCLKNGE